jgi:hypothetical protein
MVVGAEEQKLVTLTALVVAMAVAVKVTLIIQQLTALTG